MFLFLKTETCLYICTKYILNVIIVLLIMKQKIKYPIVYRFDHETFIIWLSPTKCYRVTQLRLFDLGYNS